MSTMSQVNIGGDANDRFYRYKRDVIQTRSEHKHGVQTRLLNLFAIARQLHVSVEPLVSFIKRRLGLNLTVDRAAEYCIIQGAISTESLERAIVQFIERHVLCRQCGLPELKGDQCSACGANPNSTHSATTTETATIHELTEEAGVKFNNSYERTCSRTLHEMLDWHDAHKGHPRYAVEWEGPLDAMRGRCWECETEEAAQRSRKKWLKVLAKLEKEVDAGAVVVESDGLGSGLGGSMALRAGAV